MILPYLLLTLASPPAAPDIHTEKVAENRYVLTLKARGVSTVEQGQALLDPTARRLCGNLPASFGEYRWTSEEKQGAAGTPSEAVSLRLEQDLHCGEAPGRVVNAAATVPDDWRPSEAHVESVMAASYAYFTAKDQGGHAESHAMLAESMKRMSPPTEWQKNLNEFNGRAGPVRSRRVVELTWYVNPPTADQPGVYAAADFRAEFANLDTVCGHLIWLMQLDGSWRLVREEQNLLERASVSSSAADLARLRDQMGCKG